MITDEEYREGYQKIKGRWWRSSDPRIPAPLHQELVNELMAARRAVADAKKNGGDEAMEFARFRVNAAKCALGERGHKWWLPAEKYELQMRMRMTICALLQHRPRGSLCPSEVARITDGDNWRDHMDLVREVAQLLTAQGIADITQRGKSVQPPYNGPIRIHRGSGFASLTRELIKSATLE